LNELNVLEGVEKDIEPGVERMDWKGRFIGG
jgi:hypothetical protein